MQRIYENSKSLPADQRASLMNALRDSSEISKSFSPNGQ
jgi:hypothetical protein